MIENQKVLIENEKILIENERILFENARILAEKCGARSPATDGETKNQCFFEKKRKTKKNKYTTEERRNNNGLDSAARRFVTIKLRLCCRNAVKTNTKRERQCPRGSTIIFIKKQQHSTTITTVFWTIDAVGYMITPHLGGCIFHS